MKPNTLEIPTDIKSLIIVPCYNEAIRLDVATYIHFQRENVHIHFLFVDDGSQDATSKVLEGLCNEMEYATFLVLRDNVGKAEAIRSGVLSLAEEQVQQYAFIGYLDADLSTPLEEIVNFLAAIEKNKQIKFIIGTRLARLGVDINRKRIRHYIGRLFATIVSLLLQEPVYDSQCGAKLIASPYVVDLFKEKFISKWLFDVELLFRWKIYFSDSDNIIYEHPLLSWKEVEGSKLKTVDFFYAPIELFNIWLEYRKREKKAS